ncbi:hypothetical protein VI817_004875 [Penicillium citrinum]|nr:hypothetical protein VI817_004875 [Penicillium citrinum]
MAFRRTFAQEESLTRQEEAATGQHFQESRSRCAWRNRKETRLRRPLSGNPKKWPSSDVC